MKNQMREWKRQLSEGKLDRVAWLAPLFLPIPVLEAMGKTDGTNGEIIITWLGICSIIAAITMRIRSTGKSGWRVVVMILLPPVMVIYLIILFFEKPRSKEEVKAHNEDPNYGAQV